MGKLYLPNLQLLSDLGEFFGELVVDLPLDENSRSGTASLTVVETECQLDSSKNN